MSTRSFIARKRDDGEYEAVYCHHDGYPEHMKPTLTKCFDTPEKVEALIARGDLSYVDIEDGKPISKAYADDGSEPVRICRGPIYRILRVALNNNANWTYVFEGGDWYVAKSDPERFPCTISKITVTEHFHKIDPESEAAA